MSTTFFQSLRSSRDAGQPMGITSVCSAHPLVLEAALTEARDASAPVLIEATCNQVNQLGGYTGMTPIHFRQRVESIADAVGMPTDRVILGGDHLGPNPWTSLPHAEAMARAAAMVTAYVQAGFTKIHLDCSMSCADDPPRLPDAIIAERAAQLCHAAEAASAGSAQLSYVVGTEVPAPGGVAEIDGHLAVTSPQSVRETMHLHSEAFKRAGVEYAAERIIAIVVQPGVEFGATALAHYNRGLAATLPPVLTEFPGLMFEAHSTDYQRPQALRALVEDGYGILKVGPWLTFALREALYGFDAIRGASSADRGTSLMATMEALMVADPRHWQAHYAGSAEQVRLARHFSYSDRIRYYWDLPEARAATEEIIGDDRAVSTGLISQYLPRLYEAVRDGLILPSSRALTLAHIQLVLRQYREASAGEERIWAY